MNLAAELQAADVRLEDVKNRVEHLLTALFPAWQRWNFIKPDGLEVWQANDSARAVHVLQSHGFVSVTLHGHRAERLLTCTCATHERG